MKEPFKTKTMLQNWFGNRGEEIKPSWIKTWIVKGDYLYIQWTEKAPNHLTPEAPYDMNYVNWKSLYFEFQDDVYLTDVLENKKTFDVWEFPFKCKRCGKQDNYDKDYPTCYLDVNTKLCEFCFAEQEE